MKKTLLYATVAGLGWLALAGCQNSHPGSNRHFESRTRQTYNPQTGNFEQQPPYGKQSNKSGTIPGS